MAKVRAGVLYQHGLRAGHIEKELEVFQATETTQSPKETGANLLEQELSISFSRLREVQPLRQIHPVFIGIMIDHHRVSCSDPA